MLDLFISGRIAVNVLLGEYEDFIQICQEHGLKWIDGADAGDVFADDLDYYLYGTELCINYNTTLVPHGLAYGSKSFFERENKRVVSFSEFEKETGCAPPDLPDISPDELFDVLSGGHAKREE